LDRLPQERTRTTGCQEAGVSSYVWMRFAPHAVLQDSVLSDLDDYLAQTSVQRQLEEDDAAGRYPRDTLAGLHERGLATLFAEVGPDALATPYHLNALGVLTASRTGSLGITVGVNTLALLPAYIAGTPQQLSEILGRVREGAFSALLLTELAHGSNLLRTEASAEPGALEAEGGFRPLKLDEVPTHYRIRGSKDLINGGTEHDLLFVLLRTRPADEADANPSPFAGRGALSMFFVPRQAGVNALSQWETLPVRGADIAGVEFDLVVGSEARLSPEGEGFTLIQKTLAMSRGGVSSLAAGLVASARDHAWLYAQRRNIGKHPIAEFGAIRDHLIRLDALSRIVAAISLRAAAWSNACGQQAALYSGVAKLMGTQLAEEGVEEGRLVHGGRGLLAGLPYERLVRDVLLFGVFDGTRHVMLEELQMRLGRAMRSWQSEKESGRDTVAEARDIYGTAPRSVVEVLRVRCKRKPFPLHAHVRALAKLPGAVSLDPLAELTDAAFRLVEVVRGNGAWKKDQVVRFELAECYATLESLVALVEVCDPDRRRFVMARAPGFTSLDVLSYRFALRWLSGRVCAQLLTFQATHGLEGRVPEGLMARLLKGHQETRRGLVQLLADSASWGGSAWTPRKSRAPVPAG
jgi:alkylation response protein AidB-like acyl-CoA dehydrogenase